MNTIGSLQNGANLSRAEPIEGGADLKAQLQIQLLQKTLAVHKEQAKLVGNQLEGKGQVIDIQA